MTTTLTDQRRQAADDAFDAYDFSDNVIEDANGWKHDGGNDFRRVLFVANPNGRASAKALFCVEFFENTATIETVSVEFDR